MRFNEAIANHLAELAVTSSAGAVPLKPPLTAEEILGIPFVPGARVLDKLTGSEGTVRAGTIKLTVLPTS
jgi:hypothetical protein